MVAIRNGCWETRMKMDMNPIQVHKTSIRYQKSGATHALMA